MHPQPVLITVAYIIPMARPLLPFWSSARNCASFSKKMQILLKKENECFTFLTQLSLSVNLNEIIHHQGDVES